MQKAFFSQIRSEILPLLQNARITVQVAMAWFTSSEMLNALLECRHRGVGVDLILLDNDINFMYYAPDFNQLIDAGGTVRIASTAMGIMHNKYCIIDGQTVITGSYNWTYYAEYRNLENILISDDPSIVNLYQRAFTNLKGKITPAKECCRIDWEDLSDSDNIDYDILNYEIDQIAQESHLPVRTIIKTEKPRVEVIETKLNPISKYVLGLQINDGWKELVPQNAKLPFFQELRLMNYEDQRKGVTLRLAHWKDEDGNHDKILFDESLERIVSGRKEWQLDILFKVNLDTNGYLHVTTTCVQSGLSLDFKTTDKDLVDYED